MKTQIHALAVRYAADPAEVLEYALERAAIREFEARAVREDAERMAIAETEQWLEGRVKP